MMLTRYLKRPLHFFGLLGLVMGLVGGGFLFYYLIEKIVNVELGYRPGFIVGIMLVLAALQMLTIGLLGELLINRSNRDDDSYNIERIL